MSLFGEKLRSVFDSLGNRHFITNDVIDETAKEIQKALITADVEVSLVFELSKKIKELKGEKVPEDVDSKDYLIKRIHDILANFFGSDADFNKIPKRILLLGLFGSGKTTTVGKLANYYKRKKLSVGIIAADTYRMAAYEQLKQYAHEFEVFGNVSKDAAETVKLGLKHFENKKDIIIVDSAGRNALDNELSKELKNIKNSFNPDMSFLVLSADIGQIALKQAKEFNEIVGINGIIITKLDGSAKGGGALAACAYLRAPVYFVGNGEKIDDLSQFDATRYLAQIMDYPDLQGLLERVEQAEMPDNLEEFDFDVYKKQLKMASKMGGLTKIAKMMGFGKAIPEEAAGVAENKLKSFSAIIDSMTSYERKHPDVLNTSRINRIAKGSGSKLEDVRLLIKQYNMMKETFDKMRNKNPEDLKQEDIQKVMQKEMQKKMKRKFKLK